MQKKGGQSLRALIRILILSAVILVAGFILNLIEDNENDILVNENSPAQLEKQSPITKKETAGYDLPERPKEGLSVLIGKNKDTLEKTLGKPLRIDPSVYGYEWHIYNQNPGQYVQVGVENNKIVTLYVIGADVNATPFRIGQPVEELFANLFIDANINLDYKGNSYKFELNDTDVNMRPLIKLGDIFAQAYIDKFTGKLSSVRFLDSPTLIKQRPYEMIYRGELLLADEITDEMWPEIEKANANQIFDLTNIVRLRHKLTPLVWDEETAEVAYGHSRDMDENDDFSHDSQKYGGLSDRLEAANVMYKIAGENIAANYTDAPAVVEGWMNSRGHREALLNEEYTHLGVGVYRKHYTQNFIEK